MKYNLLCLCVAACTATHLYAQGTVEDYRRAFDAPRRFSADQVFYAPVDAHWVGATHHFWYKNHTPKGDEYVLVDADAKKRTLLFDALRLAGELGRQTGQQVDGSRLNLERLEVSEGLDTLAFRYGGSRWSYAVGSNSLKRLGNIPRPGRQRHWMEVDDEQGWGPVASPDGRYEAYVRDFNLYVRNLKDGKVRQLSVDGTQGNYYSTYIQWSPDSRRIVSTRIRPAAEKRYVYYVESSPRNQLQPVLHKQEYAKPGDELRFKHPCIYDVESGKAVIPETTLFASQYDLTGLRWNADSRAVTFEYNERGHKVYRVLELSAESGEVRVLAEELHDRYVNYLRRFRYDTEDGKSMIWASERDNWNHLYLIDRKTARVKRQLTRGEWYVRGVQRVDEASGQIYFSANGMEKGEDPYWIRYYRIGMDGKGLTCLTPDAGTHKAVYSADMKYVVDVRSTAENPPVATLRNAADGSERMLLEKADIAALQAKGWRAPEVFAAPGRDGHTLMWGLIYRPSNFDASKKYPVIEYIYAGPGDQYVPKSFAAYNWNATALAELGFIVVQVDGMGTSFRSRSFENICYKNLKDAGFPDRKAWIKAAARRYPQLDSTRVGIFGASAGGQESLAAVLFHPDFYKAAYSACGCHDNRMDKIWWNELWMGYPVDSAYVASSNVANAYRLTRPLMLVVGELDDNVDPASTMQVADALIKAGKDFELVVVPGAGHTMGEAFGERKRFDFFVRNLMHREPPKWDEVKR